MIKFENTEIVGWEAAIRGMRNPKNSWEKSDSGYCCGNKKCSLIPECDLACDIPNYLIGPNDHDLMMRLRNAGTDHRKFMRMITVYVDITAPLYWQFFLPMKHFSQLSLGVTFVANGEPPIGIPWETFQNIREVNTLLYRKE